jgi:small subunit ribosomal protein S17
MEERNLRKVMIGTVVSNKMDKTVVVAVETSEKHKIYGKVQKRTYKLKAHDEKNECQEGDKVKVTLLKDLAKECGVSVATVSKMESCRNSRKSYYKIILSQKNNKCNK